MSYWILCRIGSLPPQPVVSDSWTQVLVGDLSGRIMAELRCQVGPVCWRLKGPSCTTLAISQTDDMATEQYLRPGNRVLLQFKNGLPPWGGIVDLPMKWTKGTIQFCARSADYMLSFRQTEQERDFAGATAGQILEDLLTDADNFYPLGIELGEIWTGGDTYTLSYRCNGLYKIVDSDLTAPNLSSGDFWIESREEDGYIKFRARFAERRGRELQGVAFQEGVNISDPQLTQQGPIVNSWAVIGAGDLLGRGEDEDSIALYGLRQSVENRSDIDITGQLDSIADNLATEYAQPHDVIALTVLDKAPGLLADYDVGDSVRVIAPSCGFGGYDAFVRVQAREFKPMTGGIKLVVREG